MLSTIRSLPELAIYLFVTFNAWSRLQLERVRLQMGGRVETLSVTNISFKEFVPGTIFYFRGSFKAAEMDTKVGILYLYYAQTLISNE